VVVFADALDTAGELASYDVVVLGDSGNPDGDPDWTVFDAALETWLSAGGGLVVTGFGAITEACAHSAVVQSMLPVACDDASLQGTTMTVAEPVHPVVDEVGDFELYDYAWADTSATLAAGATGLMTASDGNWAVAVRDHGAGRVVYLAPVYMGRSSYYCSSLREDESDLLLEEAVAWAAGCVDIDGDGGLDQRCGGDDCDDADPSLYAGAPELCNGVDDDCDGVVPDVEIDADGDGLAECEGDCDDSDPWMDLTDGDGDGYTRCDGDCDDDDPALNLDDLDGDGWSNCAGDCDDDAGDRYPGAPELCNGVDDDCDGAVPGDEIDDDGDHSSECEGDCDDSDPSLNNGDIDGDGFSSCDGDCDNADPDVYPGAEDVAGDGVDSDCDGSDAPSEPDDGDWGPPEGGGCGCQSSPAGAGFAALLLALKILLCGRARL